MVEEECFVTGQGLIPLTKTISLRPALCVPKLTCNLVSKLTKDLNCPFSFPHCVIQDQAMGKMIRHAKESGWLLVEMAISQECLVC